MLVITCKRREFVVVGDEVTVTVEDFCSSIGETLRGAAVRLGFQAPRSVSIRRCNLKRAAPRISRGTSRRVERPKGRVVPIQDATARLRIHVPPKVPVRLNGTPIAAEQGERGDLATDAGRWVYRITCGRQDQITICNNIAVVTMDFYRFVLDELSAACDMPTAR